MSTDKSKVTSSLLFLLVMSTACSGDVGLSDEPSLDRERRFGLISVGYEHDWVDSQDAALLNTTAQFIRYSAMDREQVARVLALPLDPTLDLPALGSCKLYDLTLDALDDSLSEAEEPGYVELLEAGDLKVETEGTTVSLLPRHFPGLLPFISGVVYGEAQTTTVRQSELVKASSNGGEAVGMFQVGVSSPTLPRLLQVAGFQPMGVVSLKQPGEISVQWQPATGTSGKQITYLELRSSREGRDLAVRCNLEDDGKFLIPASAIRQIVGRAVLEVSRMRSTRFTAEGLQEGELRVTVRDAAALELR